MDKRITSYIPHLLLDWYARHPEGQIHQCSQHQGILLLADTSGFTALTRNLGKRGKGGSEILTQLLNQLFALIDEVISLYQGDVLKFSGDAVWCYLPLETPVDVVFSQMLYQLQQLNREHEICKNHPLSLHAGASCGSFSLVTFGSSQGRLEYEIVGEMVKEAYACCDKAGSAELALTPELRQSISKNSPAHARDNNGIKAEPLPIAAASQNINCVDNPFPQTYELVNKYIPSILRQRKLDSAQEAELQSEHKQVAVMFMNIIPVDNGSGSVSANESSRITGEVNKIFDLIESQGGIVARVDPFREGHKLLALFGALAKSTSDDLKALRAADLSTQQAGSEIRLRIGLSIGPLLCGEVGSAGRKEYTVMGEAVNLAARLMSQAEDNSILLDQIIYDNLQPFVSVSTRHLKLKGIGDKVAAYRFEAWHQSRFELPVAAELYGREDELGRLVELWNTAPTDYLCWVLLSGEVGLGKTSLASTFCRRIKANQVLYLSGITSSIHMPGWLIGQWLTQLHAHAQEDSLASIAAGLRALIDQRWWPLLDQILGVYTPDNEWTRGLTADLRLDKSCDIVCTLLKESMSDRLVVLDDLEAADPLSKSILRRLIEESPSTSGMVLLVDADAGWVPESPNRHEIALAGLKKAEMECWLGALFVEGVRERELIQMLIGQCEGNPLFIRETLDQLSLAGAIGHLANETKWEVLQSLERIKLANRLEDLQLARFDSLPESQRKILRIAAIFGYDFSRECLELIAHADGSMHFGDAFAELIEQGWLECEPVTGKISFASNFGRQAIYDSTPVADLRRLHGKVGKMLVNEGDDHDLFRLAHHFSRGNDPLLAFQYSLKAAELGQTRGLLVEAGHYFRTCGQILESEDGPAIPRETQLDFCPKATEFAVGEGTYKDAYRYARRWRRLARMLNRLEVHYTSAIALARILWKQSKYNRCRQVLHRLIAAPGPQISLSLVAESYSLLGELLRRTGQLAEAQTACEKAVEFAGQASDALVESNACNNLGLAYWSAGQLKLARECFLKSLELRGNQGSKYIEARVANNLAIIAEEMGDYREARELAHKAKDIFVEIGDRRNQAYSSGNLANLLVYSGRYREALELYQAADRVFLKLGETHPHFYTIGNLGDLDMILGSFDEAYSKYQVVDRFARENKDQELEAETTVRFAEHAYYSGQIGQAGILYENAIQKAQDAGSMEYQIRGTIGLCRYLIGQRDVQDAQACIDRLVQFATSTNSDRTRHEADFLSGELLRIAGQADAAHEHYQSCLDYALKQQQFELALKSSIRIFETQPSSKKDIAILLQSLHDEFLKANSQILADKLITSGYFRFFQPTLQAVFASNAVAVPPVTVG